LFNQRGKRGKPHEKRHAERTLVKDLQHRYFYRDFETVYWQEGEKPLEAKLKILLGYVPEYALDFQYGEVLGSGR